jgi:hypothetical protein
MKYQLVLQWSVPFPIEDLDDVLAIEAALIDELADGAEVDGHDFGSSQANVFIHTDTPEGTFSALEPVLASKNLLAHMRAAYRAFEDDRYTILWPGGLPSFAIK